MHISRKENQEHTYDDGVLRSFTLTNNAILKLKYTSILKAWNKIWEGRGVPVRNEYLYILSFADDKITSI